MGQNLCMGASIIGKEMEEQMINMLGKVPDKLNIVCAIGGGSSSYGTFNNFIPMDHVTLTGVEAGGPHGKNKGADSLSRGTIGAVSYTHLTLPTKA